MTIEEYKASLDALATNLMGEPATVEQLLTQFNTKIKNIATQMTTFRRHIPYLYRQKDSARGDGNFTIDMPIDHILQDSIIYLLPLESSIEGNNNLVITQNGHVVAVYKLVKVSDTGATVPIGPYIIVPNRVVMLRLIHSQVHEMKAVVLNVTLEEEATIGRLHITETATFETPPLVGGFPVLTLQDSMQLAEMIANVNDKVVYGTQEPSIALLNLPVGTIYLQVPDDENS